MIRNSRQGGHQVSLSLVRHEGGRYETEPPCAVVLRRCLRLERAPERGRFAYQPLGLGHVSHDGSGRPPVGCAAAASAARTTKAIRARTAIFFEQTSQVMGLWCQLLLCSWVGIDCASRNVSLAAPGASTRPAWYLVSDSVRLRCGCVRTVDNEQDTSCEYKLFQVGLRR